MTPCSHLSISTLPASNGRRGQADHDEFWGNYFQAGNTRVQGAGRPPVL